MTEPGHDRELLYGGYGEARSVEEARILALSAFLRSPRAADGIFSDHILAALTEHDRHRLDLALARVSHILATTSSGDIDQIAGLSDWYETMNAADLRVTLSIATTILLLVASGGLTPTVEEVPRDADE